LQKFIKDQTLEPAPAEIVRQRQAKKDAIALLGLVVVGGASYLAYLFVTGQALPELPDLTALTSSGSQVAQGVSGATTATPSPALSLPAPPTLDKTQIAVLVASGGFVALALLIQAASKALSDAGKRARDSASKIAIRLLVIVAAAGIYAALLR
jgi:hypothetical protein